MIGAAVCFLQRSQDRVEVERGWLLARGEGRKDAICFATTLCIAYMM